MQNFTGSGCRRLARCVVCHCNKRPNRHGWSSTGIVLSILSTIPSTPFTGAVRTAEVSTFAFDAVADDTAMATRTYRSQLMDGALETVEDISVTTHDNFETLVVGVSAAITCFHGGSVIAGPIPIWLSGKSYSLRRQDGILRRWSVAIRNRAMHHATHPLRRLRKLPRPMCANALRSIQ
jgi:hypothetical protein